ncbi:proteasome subunit beta [Nitrospirales bacterium NOB]|nr:MAG: proteasome subunit beta [Nitrospira sp. OLB3]MBV6470296.1 Proteasome subunit beta [Nitrospirota bacterium]MCE7964326.1 proteasome subunit beta [Nitrospira sp. NTP2]MDL1888136.1 proteasome subunit beta [Nitrospirales bacterium NOB]MEB2337332.1 proteasome subunit beta [Nitrospirales bacterium]QOJ36599.1 MAG: proteasome subunit beta [Nitrospira sp.]
MTYGPFLSQHEGSSFFDLLIRHYPELAPGIKGLGGQCLPLPSDLSRPGGIPLPHGTTVLALKYRDGAIIAGDRRATEGFQIADRRIEKVFRIDDYSAMAIAGAAGPCIEMAKLFQTELEHYEKLEGVQLSCEGKANKLGQMVKANLPMVFQGLVVMPLYVGYDLKRKEGRIFKYDITGGRYEESDHHSIGSGGKDARNTMREHYRPGLSEQDALKVGLLALYNAADEDVGTGGPDFVRGIYPTAKIVSAAGLSDVPEDRVLAMYEALIAERRRS